MASTSAVFAATPLASTSQKKLPIASSFFNPLPLKPSAATLSPAPAKSFVVRSSMREKLVTGLTAAALTASMVVPDAAEAASSLSPSLKNFLLSIAAGGAVLAVLFGAVIGVANFDPVKRS